MTEIDKKVQTAIERLKAFEPEEGYFVAFSGGKDSQCVYHLCEMAGVKFDAHYSVTSVDPPELVRFIKQQYPNVKREVPHDKDGNPVTMWNLIPKKMMPPTRMVRYCCEAMKECNGKNRVTVTGVRWSESVNRAANQGLVLIRGKPKATEKDAQSFGVDYKTNRAGGVILNDDNDTSRRMVEHCYRTRKTMVNPIIDWSEQNVWDFLNDIAQVPHCSLYDQGWHRIGCIGCPMASRAERERGFARWPTYEQAYLRAFDRAIENARKIREPKRKTAQELFDVWMERNVLPGQMRMDELIGGEPDA